MNTTTKVSNHKNEAGFSLLELLLVVAVGAILLLAGLSAYRLVTQNNNVNEALRLLNVLKQQTQKAYQGDGTYGSSDLVPTLISLRAFPAGTLSGSTPRHPFGGTIAIDGNGDTFTISFSDMERAACISVGQAFNSNSDPDFVQLSIGASAGSAIGGTDGVISIAELTASGACPTGNNQTGMHWEFY